MADMNHAGMVGRLTKAPELSYTPSGCAILQGCIANNYMKKKGDAYEDEGQFFDFKIIGRRAERLASYLHKGSRVGLEYQLRQDRWTAQDGTPRSKVYLLVQNIQFLDSKHQEKTEGGLEYDPSGAPRTMAERDARVRAERDGWNPRPDFEDDIPF